MAKMKMEIVEVSLGGKKKLQSSGREKKTARGNKQLRGKRTVAVEG